MVLEQPALRTAGYLCVEWTVGAAMGTMVGDPARALTQGVPG